MSEKTTLLPSAPTDARFVEGTSQQQVPPDEVYTSIPMPRLILVPGLEFDPARKFRYGIHSLVAAILIFLSFCLVEFRNCNWAPGTNLDRLQALHVSLMVFAFVLYLLSMFGIADFTFQYKLMFSLGILIIYTFVGLMIWMTYEAATNPCVGTAGIPIDFTPPGQSVFGRKDGVGIIVLMLDSFATIFMISAAASFTKRY